jgi:hypothetical protein
MESDELVAFAPLDYNNINSGWKNTMPSPGLLKELIKRAKGRVFRIDQGLIPDKAATVERQKWDSRTGDAFHRALHDEDKYIECIISA